ncbi:hypothetical protein [Paenibacillus sp. YIM B09110]
MLVEDRCSLRLKLYVFILESIHYGIVRALRASFAKCAGSI